MFALFFLQMMTMATIAVMKQIIIEEQRVRSLNIISIRLTFTTFMLRFVGLAGILVVKA